MKLGWILSAAAATGAAVAYGLIARQGVRPETRMRSMPAPHLKLDRKVILPTAMAVASIAAWTKLSHGNTLKYTFVPSMMASWLLYMLTFRKKMPDPEKITVLYLLALAWQLIHFVEENSTGFRYRWPIEIFRTKPYGERQYVAINALSYAIFIVGGIALLKRRPELSLPAVFFAVMGVMYNGVQHPIYSWMVKGYFPGLFSGLVDLALGPVLLRRMFWSEGSSLSVAQLPSAA